LDEDFGDSFFTFLVLTKNPMPKAPSGLSSKWSEDASEPLNASPEQRYQFKTGATAVGY
jgi:hypothetical protein